MEISIILYLFFTFYSNHTFKPSFQHQNIQNTIFWLQKNHFSQRLLNMYPTLDITVYIIKKEWRRKNLHVRLPNTRTILSESWPLNTNNRPCIWLLAHSTKWILCCSRQPKGKICPRVSKQTTRSTSNFGAQTSTNTALMASASSSSMKATKVS